VEFDEQPFSYNLIKGGNLMTNKEWLESLSDSELAAWLCDSYVVSYKNITYTTGLTHVKCASTNSLLYTEQWLAQEHIELEL